MATRDKAEQPEKTIVNGRAVLIISDDAEFSKQVSGRWQAERAVPSFALGSDLAAGFNRDGFDLAIVGCVRSEVLRATVQGLDPSRKPVILVSESAPTTLRREFPRLLVVLRQEGWTESLVQLAQEVLRRVEAGHRADRAEQVNAILKCHATLGQYVIDMRHTMNNALTSVLGNSELLLLEPGTFSAGVRAQIDTIRNMALRMHEILQRFSSLEKEMSFVENQAVKEPAVKTRIAAVGP